MQAWQVDHLTRIRTEELKAVYCSLTEFFEAHGFRPSPTSGHVRAVRLHDPNGRYLFAFGVNSYHLLFYIRRPRLPEMRLMGLAAARELEGVSTNPSDETLVRIENKRNSDALMNWLASRFPLSELGR